VYYRDIYLENSARHPKIAATGGDKEKERKREGTEEVRKYSCRGMLKCGEFCHFRLRQMALSNCRDHKVLNGRIWLGDFIPILSMFRTTVTRCKGEIQEERKPE